MKDYPEAAKNFSNALAKAHKARNNYLQFQACEGLGAINYHMGKYGEAVSYFKQALGILDEIKQETGIPRERVMEKLSDAEEALQIMKAKQRQRDFRSHYHLQQGGSGSVVTGTPGSSSDDGSVVRLKGSPRTLRRRLSPELVGSGGEAAAVVSGHSGTEERPSLPERRGVGFLPPIGPQNPSRKHAVPRKRNSGKHHHLPPLKEGSDAHHHSHHVRHQQQHQHRGSVELKQQDSLDAEVQEYINSYRDSPIEEGKFQRGQSSGQSESESSRSSDVDGGARRDSGDQLGASVFSRHAPRHNSRLSRSPPDSLRGSSGGLTLPPHVSSPCPAYGGCLALGQNTRQLYTTQVRIVKEGRKKRKKTEIIPITPNSATSGQSPSVAAAAPPSSSSPSQPKGRTSNQSKVCVIL